MKRSGTLAPQTFLDEADGFADAAGPRLAVTGEHDVRIDALDPLQRFAREREIAPEGRELRSDLPRENVQRRKRIPDE
jgi:hypothetical protein